MPPRKQSGDQDPGGARKRAKPGAGPSDGVVGRAVGATSKQADEDAGVAEMVRLRLTKYERTKVVSLRAQMLAQGAPAFVPLPDAVLGRSANDAYFEVAERELREGKTPFEVLRTTPAGAALPPLRTWRVADE